MKSLEELYSIFTEIANKSKTKEKVAIILKYENDEDFKKVLHFISNDMVSTGLSSKKIRKNVDTCMGAIGSIYDMIDYLSIPDNQHGRDSDISHIKGFIERHDDEFQDFIALVACKDFKTKIGKTALNDIYGHGEDFGNRLHADGWLFDWDVMLAESFSKKADKCNIRMDNGEEIVITNKLDGLRVSFVSFDNGDYEIIMRSGHKLVKVSTNIIETRFQPTKNYKVGFDRFEHIINEFLKLPRGFLYDGELIAHDKKEFADNTERFAYTKTLVSKSKLPSHMNSRELGFYCFDVLPIDEFNDGKSKLNAYERKTQLTSMMREVDCAFDGFRELPILYRGADFSQVGKLLKIAIDNKEEGVMLNYSNGLYYSKRTDEILKVKKVYSVDVKCIGVYQGDRNKANANTLGGITILYKNNETNVGSGFKLLKSDEWDDNLVRDVIWADSDLIVGKIVEIEYTEEQKDSKTGILSPRFARIKSVRDDKTEESYD